MIPIQNKCVFSADRRHRYVLRHTWEPLIAPKFCTWIGLNPSIANEEQLDPTLRRIRTFCVAWGYNGFIMTNLFGLVTIDPAQLYRVEDPIGPENDRHILQAAQETGNIVAAWGLHGGHQKRCHAVSEMLSGFVLMCLKETKGGYPTHPLYVAGDTMPARYRRMGIR